MPSLAAGNGYSISSSISFFFRFDFNFRFPGISILSGRSLASFALKTLKHPKKEDEKNPTRKCIRNCNSVELKNTEMEKTRKKKQMGVRVAVCA